MSKSETPWHDAPECECGQGVLIPVYSESAPHDSLSDEQCNSLWCTGCDKRGKWPLQTVIRAWWALGADDGRWAHAELTRELNKNIERTPQ